MNGFQIITPEDKTIRFRYYNSEAPVTVMAFANALPFVQIFYHARTSGNEIWTAEGPVLDIIQENASVFTFPGEVVIGPLYPLRAHTSKCMGIYYGEGRGLDSCNIFGKVWEDDLSLLQELGERIWKQGAVELRFEQIQE